MVDLVVETRILFQLQQHPNIIKVRAVSRGNPLRANYFIVLDRLTETLKDRMIKWKAKLRKSGPKLLRPFRRRDTSADGALWKERLTNAYELTSALEHMHKERVIHRDLKPENIGYDLRGDIKIFDFGLSRQISSTENVHHLSMMTGSLRYMSPEVAKGEPYNQRCDVYSFTVLLWQMLALKRPYDRYPSLDHLIERVFERNERPKISSKWPQSIQELLKGGWHADQFQRLDICTVGLMLRQELVKCSADFSGALDSNGMRRSSRVFQFKDHKRPLVKMPGKSLSQGFGEIDFDLKDSERTQ
mmetsp:Transcript_6985/g.13798  ORF Transcript_6985/g.13798 Transcript_6985/m.13798 type:complete len:302 (+) Transcript_6985:344-1249(+)